MIIGVIVGWIAIGLVVGLIASKFVDLHGDDPRLAMGVSCGGAIVAAALYSMISGAGVGAWHGWALFFAALGAGGAVVAWHLVRSRYVSREAYTTRRSY